MITIDGKDLDDGVGPYPDEVDEYEFDDLDEEDERSDREEDERNLSCIGAAICCNPAFLHSRDECVTAEQMEDYYKACEAEERAQRSRR